MVSGKEKGGQNRKDWDRKCPIFATKEYQSIRRGRTVALAPGVAQPRHDTDLSGYMLGPRAVWTESPDDAAWRLAAIMVQRCAPAFCTWIWLLRGDPHPNSDYKAARVRDAPPRAAKKKKLTKDSIQCLHF